MSVLPYARVAAVSSGQERTVPAEMCYFVALRTSTGRSLVPPRRLCADPDHVGFDLMPAEADSEAPIN